MKDKKLCIYDEAFKKRCMARLANGEPLHRVANEEGVSRPTLYKWRDGRGAGEDSTYAPPYADNFKRKAVSMLNTGESVSAVADKFGVSRPTLYKWMREA